MKVKKKTVKKKTANIKDKENNHVSVYRKSDKNQEAIKTICETKTNNETIDCFLREIDKIKGKSVESVTEHKDNLNLDTSNGYSVLKTQMTTIPTKEDEKDECYSCQCPDLNTTLNLYQKIDNLEKELFQNRSTDKKPTDKLPV